MNYGIFANTDDKKHVCIMQFISVDASRVERNKRASGEESRLKSISLFKPFLYLCCWNMKKSLISVSLISFFLIF